MIHDAELFTIGPDELVVTFRTDDDATVTTTVGDHEITTSGRFHSARVTGLEPETEYSLRVDGAQATELLPGARHDARSTAGRPARDVRDRQRRSLR